MGLFSFFTRKNGVANSQSISTVPDHPTVAGDGASEKKKNGLSNTRENENAASVAIGINLFCLLYTSDAADE